MRASKLATVLDDGELLELPDGKTISLNSRKASQWLENPENRSFRFVTAQQSFTARKETSKKGEGDYWYGYRKVSGRLHKRYLGKSEDLTLERLKEVALALESTPEPRSAPKTPEVTQDLSVTTAKEIARLQAEITRLQNELGNTQTRLEVALGELAA